MSMLQWRNTPRYDCEIHHKAKKSKESIFHVTPLTDIEVFQTYLKYFHRKMSVNLDIRQSTTCDQNELTTRSHVISALWAKIADKSQRLNFMSIKSTCFIDLHKQQLKKCYQRKINYIRKRNTGRNIIAV